MTITRKKTKRARACGKNLIKLQFLFSPTTAQRVKTLPKARYRKSKRLPYWIVPKTEQILRKLDLWGFQLDDELFTLLDNIDQQKQLQKIKVDVPGLNDTLLPYQRDGVAFIEYMDGRALIGDEMGLGKTLQALAWVKMRGQEALPVTVICPSSVKYTWADEIKKWTDFTVHVADGFVDGVDPKVDADVIVVNYDILSDRKVKKEGKAVTLKKSGWEHWIKKRKTTIIDECHKIKNLQTKRTKATRRLGKKSRYCIALSGTPITSRPVEIYSTVSMLVPSLFKTKHDFGKRYCNAKKLPWGANSWDYSGASNTRELNRLLTRHVMIRRLKANVLDLPPKERIAVPFPLANKEEYERTEKRYLNEMKKKASERETAVQLKRIEHLKQLAVNGKAQQAIKWITDFLETEDKIVLFTTHQATLDWLMKKLSDYNPVKIDGRTTGDRQKIVTHFQTDPDCRVFIGNLEAAGSGITLTKANTVAFLELGWTPGDHGQAEDRVHRITQKRQVTIYYLVAKDSVEESIVKLLDNKRQILGEVLDGKDAEEIVLLRELIKEFERRAA